MSTFHLLHFNLLDIYPIREENLFSDNRKFPGGNMFYYTYRKPFSFLTIERIQLGIVYDF